MIQRIQSVWLLLAAIAALLTFKFAFYSGNIVGADKQKSFSDFTAGSHFLVASFTAVVAALALIAIFLYKNRKLQLRIVIITLVLSLATIVLYYWQAQKFIEGTYSFYSIISLLIPIFLILAAKGINKDQKLVKSLDRLR